MAEQATAAAETVIVDNPLWKPYRTGSYLIYDVAAGKEKESEHFRSGMSKKLPDHRYRASGSHQLNVGEFVSVLGKVVEDHAPSTIYLVDLREETHGFVDLRQGTKQRLGVAVSWYADNDFGNVGQPWPWIVADEAYRLAATKKGRATQVFAIEPDPADDRAQERVMPTRYEEIRVDDAYTEAEMVAQRLELETTVEYLRIPVTDHCAPGDAALDELRRLRSKARKDPKSWVHFHCHGGDGRTTSFLALYDMLCWKESPDPLPSVEGFARRQCQLFSYCLDPSGCRNPDGSACGECEGYPLVEVWKSSLAEVRWRVLGDFLDSAGR
jgi:hypothetical protein